MLLLLLPCLLQFMNMLTAEQSAECALAAYPYILNIPACECVRHDRLPTASNLCSLLALTNCHCIATALLLSALEGA
jgi:hypothetical protein